MWTCTHLFLWSQYWVDIEVLISLVAITISDEYSTNLHLSYIRKLTSYICKLIGKVLFLPRLLWHLLIFPTVICVPFQIPMTVFLFLCRWKESTSTTLVAAIHHYTSYCFVSSAQALPRFCYIVHDLPKCQHRIKIISSFNNKATITTCPLFFTPTIKYFLPSEKNKQKTKIKTTKNKPNAI